MILESEFIAAQGHMRHSPSVQCSETVQQYHTLVLAVAAAACEQLSGDGWISSSQYSSTPQHQPVFQQ